LRLLVAAAVGLLVRLATLDQAGDDEGDPCRGDPPRSAWPEGDSDRRGGVRVAPASAPPAVVRRSSGASGGASAGGFAAAARDEPVSPSGVWDASKASNRCIAALVAASAAAPSAAAVDRSVALAPAMTLLLPGLPKAPPRLPLLWPLLTPSSSRGTDAARM
jgi:hypothetical protein